MITAAVLTASALLLSACSASDAGGESDDILAWGRQDPMTTWEGDRCVTSVPTNLMVFDSLLRISDDGLDVTPGLAESYEYDEDTTTYTLYLRDGLAFSNGDPLTATDVVFSVDTWKAGEFSGVYYEQIASATAVDDTTVQIVMKQPDTFLPALLTWCTSNVYPNEFAGEPAADYYANPIGAGPFMIDSTNDLGGSNERVVLSANPTYWNTDEIDLDGLVIETVPDANQRVLRLQSGDLDIIDGLGDAEIRQLDDTQLVRTSPQVWNGLALNTRSDVLSTPEVREALAQAIDKDAVVEALGQGAIPAQGTLPQNLPDMVGPSEPTEYDPGAAKAVLGAINRPLTYIYQPADTAATTIANIVQSQLAEVGVQVELKGSDAATIRTLGGDGTQWDMVSTSASAISPSAFDPIGLELADQYPKTGADTTVIAEQLAVGMAAGDPADRQAAIQKIQDDAAAQGMLIGIADLPYVFASSSVVQEFSPLPQQLWYPDGVFLQP